MQANVAFHMLDVEDEEESIKEGMRLLAVVDSPWDESTLRNCRTIGSAHRHDMQTAMARANESLAAAESLRDRARLVQALDMNQWIAQRAGDWTAARSFSDRILAVIAEPRGLALRMVVEAQLGNTEQAEACAQRIGEYLSAGRWLRPGADAYFAAEAARVAGNRRWLELAKRLGLGLLRSPHPSPRFVYHGRLGLGVVAAEEHDAAAAAEQYAAVAPVTEAPHFASMFHFLGIIAQAAGLPDKAAVHFEEALTFSRKGYRAELAWTCCDYADLLRQRNGPGDGERAAALLEEGLTLARELGMRPLMERILSRRQFLKA
jgi:tetratricopeptide (TPR) repeat protein